MADTHAAAVNFLNALERIPAIIRQYEEKNEVLEREIPQLREIAGKTWKKEDELKQLKSELAALDRKIQLELAPKQEPVLEEDGKEKESQKESPHAGVSHEIAPAPPSGRQTWHIRPEMQTETSLPQAKKVRI